MGPEGSAVGSCRGWECRTGPGTTRIQLRGFHPYKHHHTRLVPHLGSVHCSLHIVPEANAEKRQGKEEGTIFLHPSVRMGASQHLQSLPGQSCAGVKSWSR